MIKSPDGRISPQKVADAIFMLRDMQKDILLDADMINEVYEIGKLESILFYTKDIKRTAALMEKQLMEFDRALAGKK